MNVRSLGMVVKGLRKSIETPKVIATTSKGPVEIDLPDLLDCFIDTIRIGDFPKDNKLYNIFAMAEEDKDQGQIFGCLRNLAQGIEPSIENDDLFLPRGKQADSILKSTQRINLWYGSVRSSKTIMSLIKWLWRCLRGPPGRRMMVGNTSETIELNCIEPLTDLLPAAIRFTSGWRHCFIFGRKVFLRGANDVGQEKKFRGPTLIDVYGDEVTTWAKSVFKMILTRLSKPGAACFLTTNPDQPLHYINVDYIERVKELSMSLWHFVLDDNPGLPEEYKADLIRENPPGTVYYLRFILGLWVAAEGMVYRFLTADLKDGYVIDKLPDDISRYIVAADYGQQHPTVFGLAGFSPSQNRWILIKEYYTNDKTNSQYVDEFDREILGYNGGIVPEYIDIDVGGGGKSLIKEMRERYPTLDIREAQKLDVAKEIQFVATAFFHHILVIYHECKRLIQEMLSYLWDSKAFERGIEQPLKQNDDGPDMLRYLWNRVRLAYQ